MRVSTSTIDSYRYLLEHDHASEDELVAQVQGKPFVKKWQMDAGTAWHSVLEDPHTHICYAQSANEPDEYYRSGEYAFSAQAVDSAVMLIGPGVWEVKATRLFGTPYGAVNVVAKVDHLNGLIVTENKTKFSQPDARDYDGSVQWRMYCLIHDAQAVQYNLFDFSDPKNGYCELRNILSFRFFPYPDLEKDCRRWLNRFLDWAASKNLLGYLEREGSSVAA